MTDESMEGLHVGYLVQQFPPEVGAGPARVLEMSSRWLARGAKVTAITAMPNRPEGRIHAAYRGKFSVDEEWHGVRALRSWLYASPKHGFARTIVNNVTFMVTAAINGSIRARGIDVLIASSPPLFPHISGRVVASLRRVPLVLEVRDLWPDYLIDMGVLARESIAARMLFALERRLLCKADAVTVVTEAFRHRIVAKGVAKERVHLLPNGVDTTFYHASQEPPCIPALERHGDEFVVGYLGNFGAGQALSTVLEAAAVLAARDPAVRFVIVGDGPDREKLERRAAELRLSNVTMHAPIPKDATRAFYANCDMCVVPLANVAVFQETIPSKIFEIMASECPVLASLDGEARRIVEESQGGLVAPPGDVDGMVRGILAMRALTADERRAMGQRGRRFVAEHYERRVIADRYLTLLHTIAGRARRHN